MNAATRNLLLIASLHAAASASANSFVGVSRTGDRLVSFDEGGAVTVDVGITGLNAGDAIVDVDFFSSDNGGLYGLGSSGQLYTLNPQTGAALTVGAGAAVGTPVAIDFNPAVDRLRVLSGPDNYRMNPFTGGLAASDGAFVYAAGDVNFGATPMLRAAAYSNNLDNPGATTFFSIDAGLDILVRHSGGPQFSTLNTVANLTLAGSPFDVGMDAGFDILSPLLGSNLAYLSNGNDLYTLNLGTGELAYQATVNSAVALRSVAGVVPEGETWLAGAGALALGAFGLWRRSRTARR
jgi:hypothetical protein